MNKKLKKLLKMGVSVAAIGATGIIFYKLGHYDGLMKGRKENEAMVANAEKVMQMVTDKTVETTFDVMKLWVPEVGSLAERFKDARRVQKGITWGDLFIRKFKQSLKYNLKEGTISYIDEVGLRKTIGESPLF